MQMNAIHAQDCKSLLGISTNDTSSAVFINEKYAGKGNIEIELGKGKYYIFIKDDVLKWNAKEIRDSVIIDSCGITKRLSYTFEQSIFLSSSPANAEVFFRDSLIGSTPLSINQNVSQIELRKENYKPLSVNTRDLSKNPVLNLDYIGKKRQESFFKTDLFKVLLGTAVALGGTAVYYKLKANDTFDQYNQSGDAALLDKTNRYDLISGITFGALQINFGVLIYYFLKN